MTTFFKLSIKTEKKNNNIVYLIIRGFPYLSADSMDQLHVAKHRLVT